MKNMDDEFTVLLTGFDPFDEESTNPSGEVIKDIKKNEIDGATIITREIPTAFYDSSNIVKDLIKDKEPDVVINVGQANGTADIRVERVALNLNDARIEDNEGRKPADETIVEDSELAYSSTIPTREIVEAIKEEGIPSYLSYSAGTYVCNHVFYSTAQFVEKNELDILYGFIHVPFLPEQVTDKEKGTPSMSKRLIKKALIITIEKSLEELRED